MILSDSDCRNRKRVAFAFDHSGHLPDRPLVHLRLPRAARAARRKGIQGVYSTVYSYVQYIVLSYTVVQRTVAHASRNALVERELLQFHSVYVLC